MHVYAGVLNYETVSHASSLLVSGAHASSLLVSGAHASSLLVSSAHAYFGLYSEQIHSYVGLSADD